MKKYFCNIILESICVCSVFVVTEIQAACDCNQHAESYMGRVCGGMGRVCGGTKTNYSLPLVELVVAEETEIKTVFCGGTLISPRHVLTAAHCIRGQPKEFFNVRLKDFHPDQGMRSFLLPVEEVFFHQKFSMNYFMDYDIAILHIPLALENFSMNWVACLPPVNLELNQGLVELRGTGLNILNASEIERPLLRATMPLIHIEVCRKAYKGSYMLTTRMICAGKPESVACQGDSGGPLYLNYRNRLTVVGIVSFGPLKCRRGPWIYTRVNVFLRWIKSATRLSCIDEY